MLFIRGLSDNLVPKWHTDKLIEAAATRPKLKMLLDVPSGGNNNCYEKGGKVYLEAFEEFFRTCEKKHN